MPRLSRNALAEIRQKAGFTSAGRAATRLHCSIAWLFEIEQGRAAPSDKLVARMAKLYGVQPERIREANDGARTELLQRQLDQLNQTGNGA